MRHAFRTMSCLLAVTMCVTMTSTSVAPSKRHGINETHARGNVQSPRRAARPQSCGEFGAGFVRMPGSDSCFRFGGGVGLGVGAVP